MLWTYRGKFLLFDWVFSGESLPDNFYVALVTADNVPTVDTNTLSELTEIADGNGYTEGGYELTPGTPDFDIIIEDDVNNLARIQIKDILWTATGGTIPASGNGARYVVLTDDSESSAAALGDRQIIAVWDMVTDRVATNGFPISITNLELRTVGLGGAVGTDSITEGEDAAPEEDNNWAGDESVPELIPPVAVWKFESGALGTDSIGNNTLTYLDVPGVWRPPVADTVNFKEGEASSYHDAWGAYDPPTVPYVISLAPYKITNGSLDVGFPLKSGDTTKKISICFWIKPLTFCKGPDETEYYYDEWFKKSKSGARSFQITAASDDEGTTYKVRLEVSATGSSFTATYTHSSVLTEGRWYHIAITFEPGDYRIRIWDDTAQAILGTDATGIAIETFVGTADLYIGGQSLSLDGNFDEIVVFDRILTVTEIDAIRTKTYPPT